MRKQMATLIREARETNDLSQADVSKALGFSTPQYISNIERGAAPLSAGHFKSISKILKVSMNKLFHAHVSDYEAALKIKAGIQ